MAVIRYSDGVAARWSSPAARTPGNWIPGSAVTAWVCGCLERRWAAVKALLWLRRPRVHWRARIVSAERWSPRRDPSWLNRRFTHRGDWIYVCRPTSPAAIHGAAMFLRRGRPSTASAAQRARHPADDDDFLFTHAPTQMGFRITDTFDVQTIQVDWHLRGSATAEWLIEAVRDALYPDLPVRLCGAFSDSGAPWARKMLRRHPAWSTDVEPLSPKQQSPRQLRKET